MTTTLMGYFPPHQATSAWERRKPAELGLDPMRLKGAVDYARSHDMPWPRDLTKVNVSSDKPPYDRKIGPMSRVACRQGSS